MSLACLRVPVRLIILVLALSWAGSVRGADDSGLDGATGTNATKTAKLPLVTPLTLTNVLAAPENRAWLAQPGVWQTAAPRGRTNDFAGVRFWLEGLLQLQGQRSAEAKRNFREKIVLPLPKPTNVTTLHLLGGTSLAEVPAETKVADVVWRYTDGSFRRTPIQYGVHMRDWWGRRYEEPATVSDPHSKSVWRGTHPDAAKRGSFLRLYLTSLTNPDTNKPVKSVELVSAMALPTMFLVGVTLDGLPPGARDGDFTDLDATRPGLTGTQFVTVLDAATDQPVVGAQVKTHGREGQDTPDFAEYDREGVTGANGVAAVQKGEHGLERLEIRVEAEDYAGYRHEFDLKKGDILPANLEVRITGGLTLGGIVEDPDGNPIGGATVRCHVGWRGEAERKVIEQYSFDRRETTTDAEGRWKVKGVPEPVLSSLAVAASHPDHVSVGIGLNGGNPTVEAQLRKQTHVLKLVRGCEMTGIVLGPDDQPFAGATVKAGPRWSGNSQREVKTGEDGRFHLRNLISELQAVTATADGYTPATKAITPGTNVTEVTLTLKQGASLKGIVLSPEGQPVPEARIVYEPRHYDFQRDNLEWEGRTDENGRFEWTSAPTNEVEFYVHKEGYAQKRNVKATAGPEDNVIRLNRARKILGVVGDAQSQEALTEFYVWPAQGDAEQFSSWSDSDRKEYSDPQGHFDLTLDDESHSVIKVGAADHTPKFVVLPPPMDDYISLVVLLEPSEDASGVVVDAAGQPVPGVDVGLVAGQRYLSLAGGRLRSDGQGDSIVKTDAEGHFKLPLDVRPFRLVAASAAGFADAEWAEFQATKTLVLLPWGRIEGTVLVGGQPAEGRMYMLSLQPEGFGEGSFNMDWGTYKVDTDKDGKFVMEKVPSGPRGLIRLIPTDPGSWAHDKTTEVDVKPGETTTVILGSTGALVTGRVIAEALLAGKEGARLNGSLAIPTPRPPENLKNQEEYRAWMELPETKAALRAVTRHTAEFKPDGTFTFEGVAPGQYVLTIMANMPKAEGRPWETIQLGQISQPVTVSDDALDTTTSLDLGELSLTPAPAPPSAPADASKP